MKNEGYKEVEISNNLDNLTTSLEQGVDNYKFQVVTNNERYSISNIPLANDLDSNIMIGIENNTLYIENNETIMSNINDVEIVYFTVRESGGDRYLVIYIKTLSNKTYEYFNSLQYFLNYTKEEINNITLDDNKLAIEFNKYYEWKYSSDCDSDFYILIGEDINGEKYIAQSGINYSSLKFNTGAYLGLAITNDNYLVDIYNGQKINKSKVYSVLVKDNEWNCDTIDYLIIFEDKTEKTFIGN